MKWLLWREYRLNRCILATGIVLILLPYLLAVILQYDSLKLSGVWFLITGSGYVTVALLAGNAIAGERADRSAEFIAYLPLGRWRIVASKLVLFLITFAVICSFTAWVAEQVTPPAEVAHIIDLRGFVIALLIIYGVGWMFTSFLSSPTYASLVAFCSLVLVSAGVVTVAGYVGVPTDSMSSIESLTLFFGWCTVINIGLMAFALAKLLVLRDWASGVQNVWNR